jgi:hypothetical protein
MGEQPHLRRLRCPSRSTLVFRMPKRLANSLKAYCGRMVVPAAVLRSAPADDWIIDASRNSVRVGIAFESNFGPGNTPSSRAVSCSARLGLTRTAVDGMFLIIACALIVRQFSSGNEMGRSVRQARTSSATKRFGHSPTDRFW